MARLLTVPAGYTDSYGPTIAELQTLAAALSGVSGAVVINQAAESFSVEYPSVNDILNFIDSGGFYIDYCGWPMFWSTIAYPQQFGLFLSEMGADSAYTNGFAVSGCSGYPDDRGWLTSADITNPAGLIYGSGGVMCGSGQTVYPMVAVKSTYGSGIYFYGGAGSNGAVDPNQFAQFILSVLGPSQGGSGTGNNSGSGGLCPPGQYLPPGQFAPGGCVPQAGVGQQQCISGGGTWVNGQCVSQGGSVTPPVKSTVNWPLIIGGSVVGLGVIIGLVALASGGK